MNGKVFISHASVDKPLATSIAAVLGQQSVWLDEMDVAPGRYLIEQIAQGVQQSIVWTVLWSEAASKSEWVRYETQLAVIQLIERQVRHIIVVPLDATPVPASLKPFAWYRGDISAEGISQEIRRQLEEVPVPSGQTTASTYFQNRGGQLNRIEDCCSDTDDVRLIVLNGLAGIGKSSLAWETVRRLFPRYVPTALHLWPGSPRERFVAEARAILSDGRLEFPMSDDEWRTEMAALGARLSLLRDRRAFIIEDFDVTLEDSQCRPEWEVLLDAMSSRREGASPVLVTTAIRFESPASLLDRATTVTVPRLDDRHTRRIVVHWARRAGGESPQPGDQLDAITRQLHGHPLAARLLGTLVAERQPDGHLDELLTEAVSLSVRAIMNQASLTEVDEKLLAVLSLSRVPLGASALDAVLAGSADRLGGLVRRGIVEKRADGYLLHPLISQSGVLARFDAEEEGRIHTTLGEILAEEARLAADVSGFPDLLKRVAAYHHLVCAGLTERALHLCGPVPGELLDTAEEKYRLWQHHAALDLLNQYFGLGQESDEARLLLARVYARLRRWSEALTEANRVVQRHPTWNRAVHIRGMIHLWNQQFDAAIADFRQVLRRTPRYYPAIRDMGRAFLAIGQPREALGLAERGLRLRPDDDYLTDLKCAALADDDRLTEAIKLAERGIKTYPRSDILWARLGELLVRSHHELKVAGEWDSAERARANAISAYDRAHTVAPRRRDLTLALANLLAEASRIPEALALVSDMRDVESDGVYQAVRGNIEKHQGDYELARAFYHRALALRPKDVNVLGAVAETHQMEAQDELRVGADEAAKISLVVAGEFIAKAEEIDAQNVVIRLIKERVQRLWSQLAPLE